MVEMIVVSFYKFVPLPDYRALQDPLHNFCLRKSLKGTVLLAEEGINGTLAGLRADIDAVLDYLKEDARFSDITYKESTASDFPFRRMKVRLKKEIVCFGKKGVDPTKLVGTYVPPTQWNAVVKDPDVLLLDTRNHYEVGIGTFEGAVHPNTETFREFSDYVRDSLDPRKYRKVALFCTGGIRCEKATSFMLDQGFEEVYHLQGGILKYLEEVSQDESLWRGECFVFDDRVTVDSQLRAGSYRQCYACRRPLSKDDLSSPNYSEGISCPHCIDELTEDQHGRFMERQKQIELARQRKDSAASE